MRPRAEQANRFEEELKEASETIKQIAEQRIQELEQQQVQILQTNPHLPISSQGGNH